MRSLTDLLSLDGSAADWLKQQYEWIVLHGNRVIVAFGITGLFLLFFTALKHLGAVPLLDLQALFYIYSGVIGGNLTLITVVVSINQLLLSRELQTPGELQSQIEEIIEYRQEVEDPTGRIAPAHPFGFLRLLVETTREETQKLGGIARDGVVESGTEEILAEVETLTEQMDAIDALIQTPETRTITVLSVLIKEDHARQINRLRQIEMQYEEDFSDIVGETIDDLVDRIRELAVARHYLQSLYLKQELSTLSRALLYAGLPAEAIATATLLRLTVPTGDPTALHELSLVLPISLTIGFIPLAVLSSFILRTATVTERNSATIPFTAEL